MYKDLLNKYFRNECTPAEARRVMDWINSDENKDVIFDSIEEEWDKLQNEHILTPPEFDALTEKINKKTQVPVVKKNSGMRRKLIMSAASVLLVFTVGLYFLLQDNSLEGYNEEITLKGQRTTIFLSDGSSILLDSDSKLIYPQELSPDNRQVYLEGQAYFKLASNNDPFIVNAKNISAAASATSFTVSAFPENEEITIAVDEGKAEVRNSGKTMPLIKLRMPKELPLTKLIPATTIKDREYIAYNKESNTIEKKDYIDEKLLFGWKDDIIYFKNANSDEITSTLERWYGVDICIEENADIMYSGEFTGERVEDVLRTIFSEAKVDYILGEHCI